MPDRPSRGDRVCPARIGRADRPGAPPHPAGRLATEKARARPRRAAAAQRALLGARGGGARGRPRRRRGAARGRLADSRRGGISRLSARPGHDRRARERRTRSRSETELRSLSRGGAARSLVRRRAGAPSRDGARFRSRRAGAGRGGARGLREIARHRPRRVQGARRAGRDRSRGRRRDHRGAAAPPCPLAAARLVAGIRAAGNCAARPGTLSGSDPLLRKSARGAARRRRRAAGAGHGALRMRPAGGGGAGLARGARAGCGSFGALAREPRAGSRAARPP